MTVSNSGPLISLARIDRLGLLPKLFRRVVIPPAVWQEVVRPGRVGAQEIREGEWIEIRELSDEAAEVADLLPIDRGESEAIALAEDLDRGLLIDERRSRSIALARDIRVLGTLGVLLLAKEKGLIDRLEPELDQLVDRGVRLSRGLRVEALHRAGEDER